MPLILLNDGTYIEDTSTNAGSGNYDAFLRLQANGTEEGFNTDDPKVLDNKDGAFTHSVEYSSLGTTTDPNLTGSFFEFRLDLNEANSGINANILLNDLKIYVSAAAAEEGDFNDTNDTFGAGFQLVFDLTDAILLSDANSAGGGNDDYRFLIPVGKFTAALQAAGLDPATAFVTLYSNLGGEGVNASGSTFEEWRVLTTTNGGGGGNEPGPTIEIVKTGPETVAEGSENVVYSFTITNTSAVSDPLTIDSLSDNTFSDVDDAALYAAALAAFKALPGNAAATAIVLASGASLTFSFDPTGELSLNAGETHINTVTVEAHDDEGTETSALDDHMITATDVDPSINIVKSASVSSIDEGAATDIVYTYEVTNTSAAGAFDPLTIDSIVDDQLGAVTYVSGDDGDGLLEVDETWIYTATATGVTKNAGDSVVNVVEVKAHDDENTDTSDTDTATVTVNNVDPSINIVKSASVSSIDEGAATDIVYTYEVTNTSAAGAFDPLTIDSIVDDQLGAVTYVSGDDGDGLLEVDETWIYTATATGVTKNAGDSVVNVVEVKAHDDENTDTSDTDTATVTVNNRAPSIDIQKTADGDGNGTFGDGEKTQAFGHEVTFKYVLTNTSAAGSFDPLTVTNLVDDMGTVSTADDVKLVFGGIVQAGVTLVKSGDGDNLLETGETWTYTYKTNLNLQPNEARTNTATVTATDDEGSAATDTDTTTVTALEGPGVRTPGFWSNLGKQFWDGVAGNETKSGPNFASGELLYQIDSNNDGAKDSTKGLLIGDYNKNGLTDSGEDTFFISLTDALKVIDASQKDLQDSRFVLGRDAVATWLNFLAGNPIGPESDSNSPKSYLNEAVDWLQTTNGGTNASTWENWTGGSAVKQSDAKWTTQAETEVAHGGFELAGNVIHQELDFYNNTGMTYLGVNTYLWANDGG